MDIDSYEDGIVNLLQSAGVTDAELEEGRARQLISHAFMKGVPFEAAGRALCEKFDIEIID